MKAITTVNPLKTIDTFKTYAWAIPLGMKAGISITDAFKSPLFECRTTERLWVDKRSELLKTYSSFLTNREYYYTNNNNNNNKLFPSVNK